MEGSNCFQNPTSAAKCHWRTRQPKYMCVPCGGVQKKADRTLQISAPLLKGHEGRFQSSGQRWLSVLSLLRLDLNMKFNIKMSGTYPVRLDEIKQTSQKALIVDKQTPDLSKTLFEDPPKACQLQGPKLASAKRFSFLNETSNHDVDRLPLGQFNISTSTASIYTSEYHQGHTVSSSISYARTPTFSPTTSRCD